MLINKLVNFVFAFSNRFSSQLSSYTLDTASTVKTARHHFQVLPIFELAPIFKTVTTDTDITLTNLYNI